MQRSSLFAVLPCTWGWVPIISLTCTVASFVTHRILDRLQPPMFRRSETQAASAPPPEIRAEPEVASEAGGWIAPDIGFAGIASDLFLARTSATAGQVAARRDGATRSFSPPASDPAI